MSKLLLLLGLISAVAGADNVYSGHYISCALADGSGEAISYHAWVTIHENVQPFQVVDVSLFYPSHYTNTQPFREMMYPTTHDERSASAEGHGKKLVVSLASLSPLKAELYVPADHQRYSCVQH